MYLSDSKTARVREIIRTLYTAPCSALSIDASLAAMMDLVHADYHAISILPFGKYSHYTVISNNPSGYMDTYRTVIRKDFLLKAIIDSGEPYVMHLDGALHDPGNREFVETVQSFRPVADLFYMPIRIDRYFFGYWSIGRAGLSSPYFSDEESDLFRFLAPFVNDALVSALAMPPPEESTAYLDYRGDLILAGGSFRSLFAECYPSYAIGLDRLRDMQGCFLHGALRPKMDLYRRNSPGRTYCFRFRLLPAADLRPRVKGIPFTTVTVREISEETGSLKGAPTDSLLACHGLTPREMQVIKEISRGLSNKTIARKLGIDESTVKRHTHNIYEKTGFRSRVELLLGIKAVQ